MKIITPETTLGVFTICYQHREDMEKHIRHEIGHYVAAKILGFPAGNMEICQLYEGGQHDCCVIQNTARRLSDTTSIEQFLEERILILFAGAMAEALVDGKVNDGAAAEVLTNGGGKNDDSKIAELIHLLRNIKYAELADEAEFEGAAAILKKDIWGKARTLVEKEDKEITFLTAQLSEKVEFGGLIYLFGEEDFELMHAAHLSVR